LSTALVIDASLAVQLLLEEKGSESIETFLAGGTEWYPLIAPSILLSETAAAITKKVRRKEIGQGFAREAFREWRNVVAAQIFQLVPANDLLESAFELSLSLHHALHDCLYLVLAQEREAAIATHDAVLARKAREIGIEPQLIRA
jgi:predicted nucleic acid-binding protein